MRYKTTGVCSKEIEFDVVGNKLKNVSFAKGCHGSLQAIGKLVEDMDLEEAIAKLDGIDCGGRGTSCPDQLAKALKGIKKAAL